MIGNPLLVQQNPETGELAGVSIDLARSNKNRLK
jgi:hypothetical protein